jgi:hypothetical protein
MTQIAVERNPFMLMLNPEVVIAAMEKSERLNKLNRHLCRPLDRPVSTTAKGKRGAVVVDDEDDGDDAELLDDSGAV